MKRYLITGGAGFIGAAIAKRLLAEGNFVRILDNEFRGSHERFEKSSGHIEFIKADIRDKEKVEIACENTDVVVHLAFINGTKYFYDHPDLVLDVGVKGMINILDGLIRHKVPELFLASSSEVYQTPPIIPTPETVPYNIPDPMNPRFSYAGGKLISELLAIHNAEKFKRVVIFRPHNVYGPEMGYEHVIPEFITKMNQLKNDQTDFPIKGTGQETRSFIYIDDFVSGVLLLLQKGEHKEIYNIGTTDEITISELASTIAVLMKKQIIIQKSQVPLGSTTRRCPDITKLKKLGFSPTTQLEEGLQKTILWYSMNPQNDESYKDKTSSSD
jgi:nucleoside-diphosphate-sugar epimerase